MVPTKMEKNQAAVSCELVLEIPFIVKHLQTLLFQFVTLINLFLQPNALLKPMIL